MPTDIFFDLDNCIFVQAYDVAQHANAYNLEFFAGKVKESKHKVEIALINRRAMKMIFHALKQKGIRIHFITNGKYIAKEIFAILADKEIYDLPSDFFEYSVFINRYSLGGEFVSKPRKIFLAQKLGVIKSNAQIVAVDDLPSNIHDYTYNKVQVIHSCGYLLPCSKMHERVLRNNKYLQEIIDICELDIELPEELKVTPTQLILIDQILKLWVYNFTIQNFNEVANLYSIDKFLQEHKFSLEELNKPNHNGLTLKDLALQEPENADIKALLILSRTKNLLQNTLEIEQEITDCLMETQNRLRELNYAAALMQIKLARIKSCQITSLEYVTNKEYFQPAHYVQNINKINQAWKEFRSRCNLGSKQLAEKIVASAIHLFPESNSKEILKTTLLCKLIQLMLQQHWNKFDRASLTDLTRIRNAIYPIIHEHITITTRFTRVINWSNAALCIFSFKKLKDEVGKIFSDFQRSDFPPALELLLPIRERDKQLVISI